MKRIIYLLVVTIITLGSCTKTENKVEAVDTKPINLEAPIVDGISKEGATLSCRILSLNNESVQDYGVLIYKMESGNLKKEQEISVGKDVKIGKLNYSFLPKGGLKSYETYAIAFYIQTEKGFYRSIPTTIHWNNIAIQAVDQKNVTSGEKIIVNGNFEGIDESYFVLNSGNQSSVSYQISSDKKSLTFDIPKTTVPHGTTMEFYLQNKTNNSSLPGYESYLLARVKIVGTIDPITVTQIYLGTPIKLTGKNLPNMYDSPADFQLIVNGIKVKYQNPLNLIDVEGLKGNNFKIGYTNGKEEIIFPIPVKLFTPNKDDISFATQVVHPKSTLQIKGLKFGQFFNYSQVTVLFDGKALPPSYDYNDEYLNVTVPDVANGFYSVGINSAFYDKLESKNKIEVRKLVLSNIDVQQAYVGDKITIKGSFIDGQQYGLALNDNGYFDVKADNGEVSFLVPDSKTGHTAIKIYYYGTNDQYYAGENLSFKIEKSSISSVSPLQAYPGDLITVKGNGLTQASFVYLGGKYVNVVNRTKDGFQFLAPSNFIQSKGRVTININEDIIQSDDYIEIK
ncbi:MULTISPECIES: IPT/TIG domain-containing protein [Sphingobacterium]|uniref:IPT/TIG domain-containing protein n=1 Tax=Sphingobacterium TaxID=28453 RepID=UPI001404C223|nr:MULTISPECIES: IPT/TIG domain-containing protein [Sphingobacterium]MCW2260065.1 hypothetical protein [Sphingobacterium kitahiroshimense]NJI72008.1 hypothetical protein [Sphingobacterium sp. B16(2022)]